MTKTIDQFTTFDHVLVLMFRRQRPVGSIEVGEVIRPDSKRMRSSNGGGGDFAAQMLLGRMKKAGLVRHAHSEGSSQWELTAAGRSRATALF